MSFTKQLFEKYPALFYVDEQGQNTTPSYMVDCPPGWENVVDELCGCIVDYTTRCYRLALNEATGKYEKQYAPGVKIDQIKSKFAGLRFYYTGGDKEVAGMVRLAEHMCSNLCENTGQPGKMCVRNGWYTTLCEDEMKRLGAILVEGGI